MTRSSFPRARAHTLSLAFAALAGCGSMFGIDSADYDDSTSAAGGVADEPVDASGTTARAGRAGGGGTRASAGSAGNGGASGRQGTPMPSGGAGGFADGGTAGGGAGSVSGAGGVSGDGGAGVVEWPRIGDACSRAGTLSCLAARSRQTAVCDGAAWVSGPECEELERCDRTTGTCAPAECLPLGDRFCSDDVEVSCGPDSTWILRKHCVLGCDEASAACRQPSTDELVLDRPPPIETMSDSYWPDPLIPVCVKGSTRGEWQTIRDEVERTWGRYSAVAFLGWSECTPASSGVELTLVDGCEGELGGVDRYGYPGSRGRLRVRLCTSYFDAAHPAGEGEPVATDPDLLRLVARHEFGHVLDFEDVRYDPALPDFMMPALRISSYRELAFGAAAIAGLRRAYGAKPQHSLVTPEGSCVSMRAGEPETSACDGSPATRWQISGGRVRHADTDLCLHASTRPGPIQSADCSEEPRDDPARHFQPLRVQWRADTGDCVSVREAPEESSESPLVIEPCVPGANRQTFRFELEPSGEVRIVHAPSGRCVTAPDVWSFTNSPGLSACSNPKARFVASSGQLSADGHCLNAVFLGGTLSVVAFATCRDITTQRWELSGAWENTEGMALTRSSDGGPLLRAAPARRPAAPEQIFDYYF